MPHFSAVLLVLLAGTMWAASGTAAQHFYTQSDHVPLELTQVRLFLSSALFFLLAWWSGGLRRGIRSLRRNPSVLIQLAIHGILGIMIVQFSYFMGIAEGDAAATTVIGYTSPAMMILYLSLRYRRRHRAALCADGMHCMESHLGGDIHICHDLPGASPAAL